MKIDAHRLLALHILAELPHIAVEHEWKFHPKRRWAFDVAFPVHRVAVEVDGGGWIRGRHHRPAGYQADCEKLNAATEMGWRVFRYVPAQVESGEAIRQLKRVLR